MFSERYFMIIVVIAAIVFGTSHANAQGRSGGGSSKGPRGTNTIQGTITDDSRNPVYNAYVELYNNFNTLVGRQQSSGAGRFVFRGMAAGRYTIKVKPYGTALKEDSLEVDVRNEVIQSDTVNADFQLQKNKRHEPVSVAGTIFAQEVPESARRLFRSGVENIDRDHSGALSDLEQAVRIAPTYFDALAALGKAYILDGKYEQGYPFLLTAIDVNNKCGDCFYTLGLAFYKLNQVPAGIKAADAAAILSPQSVSVHLLRGMLYLHNNNTVMAEKALNSANSLAKGTNAEVHWQLALVYNRTKRNQEAANELEAYLKVKQDLTATEKENVRDLIQKMRNAKT
jgi:tetratricopeptide (TPR) repeat protein